MKNRPPTNEVAVSQKEREMEQLKQSEAQEMLALAQQIAEWERTADFSDKMAPEKWLGEEVKQQRRAIGKAVRRLAKLLGDDAVHLPSEVNGKTTIKTVIKPPFQSSGLVLQVTTVIQGGGRAGKNHVAVSYTHLTLPTICSV